MEQSSSPVATEATAAPISVGKKALFSLLLFTLVMATLETLGAIYLWSRKDPETSRATIQATLRLTSDAGTIRGAFRVATNYSVHPYLGAVSNPEGASFGSEKSGISRLGFLGTDASILATAPKETFRVAITGGSVAQQFALLCQVDPSVLSTPLAARIGRPVVVANLAVAGWKQPQQLMAISYFAAHDMTADLYINLDGANDIAIPLTENRVNGYSLDYPRSWDLLAGGALSTGGGGRASQIASILRDLDWWRTAFSTAPLPWSSLALLVWKKIRKIHLLRVREIELSKTVPEELPPALRGPFPPGANEDEAASARRAVEIWSRSSARTQDFVEALGGRYLHVLQPNQYVAGTKPMSPEEKDLAIHVGSIFRPAIERYYQLLRREGEALLARGVPFLDATGVFATTEQPLYVDDCCHFNDDGNRILAGRILEELVAQGYLK